MVALPEPLPHIKRSQRHALHGQRHTTHGPRPDGRTGRPRAGPEWARGPGTVADELYGLAPADFIARRDGRAAEARRAGDRDLADAIKKLRRPSAGAWLANLLVRQRHEQVSDLLNLGTALRDAQARLAHDDVRKLSKERRRLVAGLVDEALGLARDLGQPVSSATVRELEGTLEAALLDTGAAQALASGRLAAGLRYMGLGWSGPVDMAPGGAEDETVGPALPNPERTKASVEAEKTEDAETADKAERERHVAAGEALRQAEAAAARSEQDAQDCQRRVQEARQERDRCHQESADLEQRLRELRAAGQQAERHLREAEKELGDAEHRARTAQDRLAEAYLKMSKVFVASSTK